MDRKFGVIADDLTGAMDAGVQLLKKGIKVSVAINHKRINEILQKADVVIVNTESRNIDSQMAYARVKESISFLHAQGVELIYKKIDSTLRGNIGIELDAVMDSTNKELILVAPALPFNGRTTIGGYHYVNGVKLEETEFATDPFSPVAYSYVPDIISLQSGQKVSTINLETVRKGEKAVKEKVNRAYDQGCTIVVMDAMENEDLRTIALAAMDLKMRVLLCGSAGLFQYVPQLLESKGFNESLKKQGSLCKLMVQNNNRKPVIIVSGSPALMSKRQIEFAIKHLNNVGFVKLHNDALFESESSRQKELHRVQKEIERMLLNGMNLIIDGSGIDKKSLFQYYKGNLELLRKDSDILLKMLSDILERIINKSEVGGLILFGGETAFQICNNLGVLGICILGEVEPYVPAGIVKGGKLDGLPIITKAGGFGSESVLISAVDFFSHLLMRFQMGRKGVL